MLTVTASKDTEATYRVEVTDPAGPPPPSAPPVSTDPSVPGDGSARPENPIAIAGLVCSVLALICAAIVIGGVIGVVSFALSAIGLRRARLGARGRGVAIGGIVLSLLAIAMSIVALLMILSAIRGEDTVVDGIATTSSNTRYPPQSDLDDVQCETSRSGAIARAFVTLTNRSTGPSIYEVTVAWDSPDGRIETLVSSEFVDSDETIELDALELTGRGEPDSCRVTRIERSGLPFFN